jgi:hypothetical protein
MDVDGVEVVTRDGTTIRILSKNVAEHTANPWDTVLSDAEKRPT